MTHAISDSAVLLRDNGFLTPLRARHLPDGTLEYTRDGSLLVFLVEQLIAHSSTNIAMFEHAADSCFVDLLPKIIRNRIIVLNKKHLQSAIEFREGLFAPIMNQIGFSNPNRDNFAVAYVKRKREKAIDPATLDACFYLYFNIGTFLLGMDQKLSIEANVDKLLVAAQTVRAFCNDPESRMALAALEGLLGTYTTVAAPMLQAVPTARPQLIEIFRALLEDEAYQELVREAKMLGIPRRARRALTLMRRSIGRLAGKSLFKDAFDVGTQAITIATQVPMPSSGIADSVKHGNFLPPIISLDKAISEAWKIHESQLPDMIPYPMARWGA